MANNNQLIVEVLGDTTRLQSSLRGAEQQINRFATKTRQSGSAMNEVFNGKVFDAQRKRVSAFEEFLQQYDRDATATAARREQESIRAAQNLDRQQAALRRVAVGGAAAGIALHVVGQNLALLGGNAKRAGDALSAITSGNVVGFFQALGRESHTSTEELLKVGDAAKLSAIANKAAAAGFDGLAKSARDAAVAVGEAQASLVLANLAARESERLNFGGPGGFGNSFGITQLDPNDPKTRGSRKGISATQRNAFFDNALARDLDRVQDSELRGQVTKLRAIADTITQRIAITKDITRKLRLEDELAGVNRQRRGIEDTIARNAAAAAEAARLAAQRLREAREAREKALAEARRIALQSKQFRALGFAADGSDAVAGIGNLRTQLSSLTNRLAGSSVNLSSKLESQLKGVRKVLNGEMGKATRESRSRIQELFDTIRGEFDKGAKGPLTKTTGLNTKRIIEGLGLSTTQASEIRGRLSGVNSAGISRAPVVESHVTVQMDGHTVAKTVTRSQQKRRKRNPSQRRGPNRGGWV